MAFSGGRAASPAPGAFLLASAARVAAAVRRMPCLRRGLRLRCTRFPGGRRGRGICRRHSAFALGTLALTGPRFPGRVRAFLLSVTVVDDLVSLVVIGAAYSKAVVLAPLGIAAGIFAVILLLRRAGSGPGSSTRRRGPRRGSRS